MEVPVDAVIVRPCNEGPAVIQAEPKGRIRRHLRARDVGAEDVEDRSQAKWVACIKDVDRAGPLDGERREQSQQRSILRGVKAGMKLEREALVEPQAPDTKSSARESRVRSRADRASEASLLLRRSATRPGVCQARMLL
jgi:hypothetical protein